ncbi:hypothetical protein AGMMS49982_07870 [Bacteroidia bacterium]|nr:hypothetical protein AGMMS49982_07870 [Bacteroidia bacterium]
METVERKVIKVTKAEIEREIEELEAQYGDKARNSINLLKGIIVPGSDEDIFNLGIYDNNIFKRGWA